MQDPISSGLSALDESIIHRIDVWFFVSDIDWRDDVVSRFARVFIIHGQTFAPVIILNMNHSIAANLKL